MKPLALCSLLLLLLLAVAAPLTTLAMPIEDESLYTGQATDFNPLTDPALHAFPHHVYGTDVSQPHSAANFRCMSNMNLTFTVVRAWRSLGNADPNAPATIANAWAGGQRNVDVYMFPCPKCGDPAGQVTKAAQALRNAGSRYGMFWLDVEGPQYWTTQAANRAFYSAMINQGQKLGLKLGIYTSKSQWDVIMGPGYTVGGHLDLWYPRYNGRPEFADFVPFGGWTRPAIKQFTDQGANCGSSYDINWYPA